MSKVIGHCTKLCMSPHFNYTDLIYSILHQRIPLCNITTELSYVRVDLMTTVQCTILCTVLGDLRDNFIRNFTHVNYLKSMILLFVEMIVFVVMVTSKTQSPQLNELDSSNLNDLRQYDLLKFIHIECKSVVPDIYASTLHYRKIARQVTKDMQDVPIALYSTYWNIAFYLVYLQYKVTPLGGMVLEISGHSMLTKYFKRNTMFTHTTYPEVDVTRLDQSFRGSTFDVVIMDRVLEHVWNPMLAISQCYHVLKPGGKLLVISFSNHPYHWGPWDFNRFTTDTLKVLASPFSSIDLCGSYRSTKMMQFLTANYTSATIHLANHSYLRDIILEAPALKSISMPDYGVYRGGSKPSNRTWKESEQYERTSSGDPKYGEFVFTSWMIASKHDKRSVRTNNKRSNAPPIIDQQNIFDLTRFDLRYIYHNKCIYHIPDMHEKTMLYQQHPMIVRQVNNDMKNVHVTRYSTYWNIAYYLLYMHHHVSPLGGKVLEISGHSLLSKYFMKNNTEFIRPSYPEVDVTRLHEVYQPNSFDIVILDQVLEHVANPMLAVSECHYVLKPGGKLVVISPGNYPYHWGPWDFNRFTTDTLKVLASPFSSIDLCGSYRSTKMMQFLTKHYPRVYKNPADDKNAEEIALEAPALISINQTYYYHDIGVGVDEEQEEQQQSLSTAMGGGGGGSHQQQKKKDRHGDDDGMVIQSSGDAKYGEFVFASWMIVSK